MKNTTHSARGSAFTHFWRCVALYLALAATGSSAFAAPGPITITPANPANPASPAIAVPFCQSPDPAPTGPSDKPMEGFPAVSDPVDHRYLHSSTHLQGELAVEKWAPLLYMPPDSTGFAGFTSAVVVNNPNPNFSVTVTLDYFDHVGAQVGSNTTTIIAEGTHIEAATPLATSEGVGSVRVRSQTLGITGAVLFHTETVDGILDSDIIPFTTSRAGAGSMQQLQKKQDSPTIWWGPLTLSTTSGQDFLNGNSPLVFAVNPTDLTNRIRIDVISHDRNSGITREANWRVVDLPPRGTLLELDGPHLAALGSPGGGMWNRLRNLLLADPAVDIDISVRITSLDNLPLLGDGLLTDFYGDGDGSDGQQVAGKRFRMSSMMFANTPSSELMTPDFSYEVDGIVQTLIGVHNVGLSGTGPLRIEYFASDGTLVSSTFVANLPSRETLRIGPGGLGYPSGTIGFGWARIRTCQGNAQMIGWAARETTQADYLPENAQFHKVMGESLIGITGAEPGDGFAMGNMTRKVVPVARITDGFDWPGYTTMVNDSVNNLGQYEISYWFPETVTFECGTTPLYVGLPFAETASTYEDVWNVCTFAVNQSGRVDHSTGTINGIDVVGDPFTQWRIDGFAGYVDP